jgi:hypothetical protein
MDLEGCTESLMSAMGGTRTGAGVALFAGLLLVYGDK